MQAVAIAARVTKRHQKWRSERVNGVWGRTTNAGRPQLLRGIGVVAPLCGVELGGVAVVVMDQRLERAARWPRRPGRLHAPGSRSARRRRQRGAPGSRDTSPRRGSACQRCSCGAAPTTLFRSVGDDVANLCGQRRRTALVGVDEEDPVARFSARAALRWAA